MSKKKQTIGLFIFLAAGILIVGAWPSLGRVSEIKNIIIISIDTFRADRVGPEYAHLTPNIQRLASGAAKFSQAYANSHLTLPSHMTMLTGTLPLVHGVLFPFFISLMGGGSREVLPNNISTLAELLSRAGFVSAWFADPMDPWLGHAHGFYRGVQKIGSHGLYTQEDADEILNWIASQKSPAFAFLHTKELHSPYLLDEKEMRSHGSDSYNGRIIGEKKRFDSYTNNELDRLSKGFSFCKNSNSSECKYFGANMRTPMEELLFWGRVNTNKRGDLRHLAGLYNGKVAKVDRLIGYVFDRLKAKGLLDKTLVIITSDHGEAFFEHGSLGHQSSHNEILQVPLLFVFPKNRFAGIYDSLVQSADIVPTILDLLKLKGSEGLDGKSLVPLFNRAAPEIHSQIISSTRMFGMQMAVRTKAWTLISGPGGKELYCRESDMEERKNIYRKSAPIVTRLENVIKQHLLSARVQK